MAGMDGMDGQEEEECFFFVVIFIGLRGRIEREREREKEASRGEGDGVVDDVIDDVGGQGVDGPCKMGSYSASIQILEQKNYTCINTRVNNSQRIGK